MRHLLLVLTAACAADDPAPQVSVVSASPDSIAPADDLADDVTITVEYDDADGDLGGGFAKVYDCRDTALLTKLAIPPLASDAQIGEHIRGSLALNLTDVGDAPATATFAVACSELGISAIAEGTTVFCIRLVDAADHEGSGDCTSPITLR